jgi:galactonate dehydratase
VAAGERIHTRHDFRELIELQAVDILQPDISMCGGIRETLKLAAWADVYYVRIAPHNVGGPVGTAAALHFAATATNFAVLEHFNDFTEAFVKDAAPGNPEVVDGSFDLPTGPGLGVVLNEDVIAEHPRSDIYFDLFNEDWQFRQALKGGQDGSGSE